MSGFDERDAPSWGPRHTADLVGHGAAEATLIDAWGSGRMAHAWLITGPKGIGKATLAFRFARFLLARGAAPALDMFGGRPDSLLVAPDDPVFARVAAAGHADLLTVERSWNDKGSRWRNEIVIDDVRRVTPFFGMTAGEGGWRICILDAADEMNRNAANAVLKILEEPPARALILLVAHAPGRLLPTIRSRCRRLALRPLAEPEVAAVLAARRPDLPEGDRAALARLAEGSPGRALALAEQGGLDLYREMVGLIGSLPALEVEKLHAVGDRFGRAAGAAAFTVMMDLLGWWLARLVRAGATGAAIAEIVPGEAALMRRLAAIRGLDQWVEVWENLSRLVALTDSLTLDRKQVALNVFSSLERAARG
jgi:DNA polymerase-3 subunit delta'